MIQYLIDTNVFIRILKGDVALKTFVESLPAVVDTIVCLELIQGAKDKSEVQRLEQYLTRFELISFDKDVSTKSVELVRIYSKSHGLMLADAVITATCLEHNLTLVTFNIKDFQFVKGLTILQP